MVQKPFVAFLRYTPTLVSAILLLFFIPGQVFGQVCPEIDLQVLRVFCAKTSPYYHKPWKSPDFTSVRGSGFFFRDAVNFPGLEGLILTNAHTISQSQSIKVSNGREKRQYRAKVLGICDIADFTVLQLEPEDLDVYEKRNGKITPLELGDSDKLRVGDKVLGWGYPLGGEGISKSEQGEISRIEVSSYAYSHETWLMMQASLQQNRGNSGGPVIKDEKVVGISFQGMRTTDRINYFIPINVVKNLLPSLGNQEAIPKWRYRIQYMFPRLKDYFGLNPDQGGILLDNIVPEGGPHTFGLRVNDIITQIDGYEIDNFGEIHFKPLGQKIYFTEILNRKKVGDDLTITVIRGSETLKLEGKVTRSLPRLVPKIFTRPNYFIFSGIGFVELTSNAISEMDKAGEVFRSKYSNIFPERPYEKVVIISEIFPDYGLTDTGSYTKRVIKLDDEPILNVPQLYEAIHERIAQGHTKAILTTSDMTKLPLDLKNAATMDEGIKQKYGILNMKTPGKFSR